MSGNPLKYSASSPVSLSCSLQNGRWVAHSSRYGKSCRPHDMPRVPHGGADAPHCRDRCLTGEHVHGFLSSSARHVCIPKAPVLLHLTLAPWRPRARQPCHGGCDCEPWRPRPGGRMPRPSPHAMEAASQAAAQWRLQAPAAVPWWLRLRAPAFVPWRPHAPTEPTRHGGRLPRWLRPRDRDSRPTSGRAPGELRHR